MDSHWAASQLAVIRTLMERVAVYRRALVPTACATGAMGLLAAVVGWTAEIEAPRAFGLYWILVCTGTLATGLVLMRREALRDSEPFWSPPARRVTAALLPPLVAGLVIGLLAVWPVWREPLQMWWLPPIWMVLYGCSLHAAGFFMPRGIRLFGWVFVILGCVMMAVVNQRSYGASMPALVYAHWVMGGTFGGLHLVYGTYLWWSARQSNAA